ncbi:MATE family efflux transporter [Novosphingobium sp. ZN18A2]|uniref:MATE family efflux transporter n=1 Tax=Novosphingobium sp. ZN18A2 TaxID=3079861 RepID=UPI0030CE1ECA
MFDRPASTWPQELAATARLAAPLVGANLLQMAVYSVDVVFISRLGQEQLAASSLSVALFGLLLWSMTSLVGAASPLIAAELGKRRHAVREVRRTVRMAGWLALLSGLFIMAVCMAGIPLMRLTGQEEAVIARARPFLHILMFAAIPSTFAMLQRTFVSTLGRAGIGTAVTLLALIVNTIGNYVFVFGHFGMPALGLEGSALSSVTTSLAMCAAYAVIIRRDRRFRRYRLMGNWWKPEAARFFELVRIGLPIAATVLAEAGLFSGAAFVMGRIGEAELAAHTVALQLVAIAFQVPYGVSQAATIRVGLAYGARDAAGIARAGWTGIVLGIGFMAVSAITILLAPLLLLRLYIDPDAPQNAAMVGFALQFMTIAAAFQLFDGAQAVGAGVLRGLQDTRVPMVYALFGYWAVGFSASLWLGLRTPLGGTGVWLGLMAGLVVVAALMLQRWGRRRKLALLPA